jgi:potassium channel subfamily K, other eukaryote
MMETLLFFIYIGLAALTSSKVEGYTYVDAIYYMVVTTLTIGFGDITPQTATFRVLTFPFTVIGIALLAIIVTSIVRLLADRARRRKSQMKEQLKKMASEKKRSHGRPGLKRSLTLHEELHNLREDDWKRERRANLRSVATGIAAFLVFWFVGALIFYFVEVSP